MDSFLYIAVQKMMPGAALLVRNHRIQIYIFHAPEDVFLYLRVLRCKCADQVLDRTPFGALLCAAAGSAAISSPLAIMRFNWRFK